MVMISTENEFCGMWMMSKTSKIQSTRHDMHDRRRGNYLSMISIFGIILIAAAINHSHENHSVVPVVDLRSQSPTVNREKVTKGRQQSNVRDFARCHGVLPLGA
jgi:hypothetical protein